MDAKFHYREAAVRGASPVQLVIFLYEQVIEDVRRALSALRQGDIEIRTQYINHALKVIGHLQGSLNMEEGGVVAENLYRFYNQVRSGLLEAQGRQSQELLEQQISQLVTVREAWAEVERVASPTVIPASPTPLPSEVEPSASEWNA
jgi:flagellar secretion chaperone FliS